MKRELLLLRHAKSDRDGRVDSDFERPLAKRGRKDAPRVGAWLRKQGLLPDLVLSSPAVRAGQTTAAVIESLELPAERVQFDERLYLADCQTLLEVLAAVPPRTARVLLVAHNPGLDELLECLAEDPVERTDSGKLMTTATLAWLATDDPWRTLTPGGSRLVRLVRPKDADR